MPGHTPDPGYLREARSWGTIDPAKHPSLRTLPSDSMYYGNFSGAAFPGCYWGSYGYPLGYSVGCGYGSTFSPVGYGCGYGCGYRRYWPYTLY